MTRFDDYNLDKFKIDEFEFMGRAARVICPEKADERRSWAFKMEYRDEFPEPELALLNKGYHVAFIKNKTRFGSDDDMEIKQKFAKYIVEKYSLNEKCVPVGMSLGGAQSVIFAGKYPELVEGIYIDAPVLNFCMYWDECRSDVWKNEVEVAYPGLKRYHLLNFYNHPMNYFDVLVENRIPVLMLWGTQDETVLYKDNGMLLEEAYAEFPELLTVMKRQSEGHHPHGFGPRSYIIADYIAEHMQK